MLVQGHSVLEPRCGPMGMSREVVAWAPIGRHVGRTPNSLREVVVGRVWGKHGAPTQRPHGGNTIFSMVRVTCRRHVGPPQKTIGFPSKRQVLKHEALCIQDSGFSEEMRSRFELAVSSQLGIGLPQSGLLAITEAESTSSRSSLLEVPSLVPAVGWPGPRAGHGQPLDPFAMEKPSGSLGILPEAVWDPFRASSADASCTQPALSEFRLTSGERFDPHEKSRSRLEIWDASRRFAAHESGIASQTFAKVRGNTNTQHAE